MVLAGVETNPRGQIFGPLREVLPLLLVPLLREGLWLVDPDAVCQVHVALQASNQ